MTVRMVNDEKYRLISTVLHYRVSDMHVHSQFSILRQPSMAA